MTGVNDAVPLCLTPGNLSPLPIQPFALSLCIISFSLGHTGIKEQPPPLFTRKWFWLLLLSTLFWFLEKPLGYCWNVRNSWITSYSSIAASTSFSVPRVHVAHARSRTRSLPISREACDFAIANSLYMLS